VTYYINPTFDSDTIVNDFVSITPMTAGVVTPVGSAGETGTMDSWINWDFTWTTTPLATNGGFTTPMNGSSPASTVCGAIFYNDSSSAKAGDGWQIVVAGFPFQRTVTLYLAGGNTGYTLQVGNSTTNFVPTISATYPDDNGWNGSRGIFSFMYSSLDGKPLVIRMNATAIDNGASTQGGCNVGIGAVAISKAVGAV
jgi:hypothetical protein